MSPAGLKAAVGEAFMMDRAREDGMKRALLPVVQQALEEALAAGGRPEVTVSVELDGEGLEVVLIIPDTARTGNTKASKMQQKPVGAQQAEAASEAEVDALIERGMGDPRIEAAMDEYLASAFGE